MNNTTYHAPNMKDLMALTRAQLDAEIGRNRRYRHRAQAQLNLTALVLERLTR